MTRTLTPDTFKSVARRYVIGKRYAKPLLYSYSKISRLRFSNSSDYWEKRYAKGANSGAGSYGRLAEFKAEFLNSFVAENGIHSVIELGCGDGHQLSLASYPDYTGLDVSQTAVDMCSGKFEGDATRKFFVHPSAEAESDGDAPRFSADLSLSLDVIYHLVEDNTFHTYMTDLFSFANRHVIIYSSNKDAEEPVAHVRHRKFTDWVESNTDWKLDRHVPNPYPYDEARPDDTSWADFYVFSKPE